MRTDYPDHGRSSQSRGESAEQVYRKMEIRTKKENSGIEFWDINKEINKKAGTREESMPGDLL